MHCLVVTIFYCVDNHFTSFVIVLLLLAMVYNEFCYPIYRKNNLLCISDRLSVLATFQIMNIGYWKAEKFDIGTPLPGRISCEKSHQSITHWWY